MDGEPRFWLLDAANNDNRLDEAQRATGMWLAALVDEEAGGVVGYLLLGEAERIVRDLNATDQIRKTR